MLIGNAVRSTIIGGCWNQNVLDICDRYNPRYIGCLRNVRIRLTHLHGSFQTDMIITECFVDIIHLCVE